MAKTPFELRNEVLAQRVVKNLQRRAFDACYCATKEEALEKALSLIDKKQCVSWGGSMTLEEMGLLETLRTQGYNVIDRDTAKSPEERLELLRKALTCDTYFMSTNAMSEDGVMVNIDGTGNRVAAMVFGPKSVVVIAGINKVVKSYEDAVARARNLAAPVNVQRFANFNPPCKNNGHCFNCTAPDSICNFILTTRKGSTMNAPAPRIKVILVGESLGY